MLKWIIRRRLAGLKDALGHGRACSRVTVGGESVAPAALAHA